MSERDPALQELLDHRAISQLSIDYMRALDRLDGELLRSVYHPDATDDRGFFAGSGPEFCDFALGVLASHKTNHHMLGQMNIAIEGDIAFGEIYFNAYHRIASEGEGTGEEMDFVVIGRYVDRYERRRVGRSSPPNLVAPGGKVIVATCAAQRRWRLAQPVVGRRCRPA